MKKRNLYCLICLAVLVILHLPAFSGETRRNFGLPDFFFLSGDTIIRHDSVILRYPFNDETTLPGSGRENHIYLKNPSNIKTIVEYDPLTRQYYYVYKIGETTYRLPTAISGP